MVLVPWKELSAQALRGLLESVVNREGTDYGEYEISFDDKVTCLYEEVLAERAVIVHDMRSDSTTVMPNEVYAEFLRMQDAANE